MKYPSSKSSFLVMSPPPSFSFYLPLNCPGKDSTQALPLGRDLTWLQLPRGQFRSRGVRGP